MTESNLQQNQELNLNERERSIAAANQNSSMGRIVNVVYFLFGALQLLLAVRLILQLLAANAENGFVSFIYSLSAPFVALFATMLENPAMGNGVLEITTLVAMLAYAILAWLVGRMIWLALSRPR